MTLSACMQAMTLYTPLDQCPCALLYRECILYLLLCLLPPIAL